MKSDIQRIVDRYGQLEQRVCQQMTRFCRPFCSVCRQVCCQSHFCLETRESTFLGQVVRCFPPQSVFDPSRGWLSATGCTLVAGRPPVCYEFLCRSISGAVSATPDHHHALLALSMVMTYVGRRAVGGRHLVEVTHPPDLNRINPDRLGARLHDAKDAALASAAVLDGRPSDAGMRALCRIVSPPRTDRQKRRRSM
ncbi:hypothetical protein [Desulfosarcina alkanivorans]|uniref:hypothetical protein n=1 Tax=Desulfosarcina alkanivorans TaxID=571177 RepID=UPI0012D30AFD|nr:hypothetical protein [Desulfosarcina alkanivorans]